MWEAQRYDWTRLRAMGSARGVPSYHDVGQKYRMPMKRPGFRAILTVLFCVLLCTYPAAAELRSTKETLSSLTKANNAIRSFDVYHVSDIASFRTQWTLYRLISSKDGVEDFVHISGSRAAATELQTALAATSVQRSAPCRDLHQLDVRWAIVLSFWDGTRSVIGFNLRYQCVELQTEANPVAIHGAFVPFIERNFRFMIDRFPDVKL